MAKKVTTASTKKEILEAYNELLSQKQKPQETEKETSPQVAKESKPVQIKSPASVMKEISDLRIGISSSLDELEEKLIDRNKILEQVSKKIEEEKEILDELYGIQAEAESLAILIEAQKQKRDNFEQEMTKQRKQ